MCVLNIRVAPYDCAPSSYIYFVYNLPGVGIKAIDVEG